MAEITEEKFTEIMLEEFTGVGNEYDEPEDEEDFKEKIKGIWEKLTT